jgi:hypothetical protein
MLRFRLIAAGALSGAAFLNSALAAQNVPTDPLVNARANWTVQLDAGGFQTGGNGVGFAGTGDSPRSPWGGQFGLALNYRPDASDWTYGFKLQHGLMHVGKVFNPTGTINETATASSGETAGTEDHWLADFDVGRDVAIGTVKAHWEAGLRVAEIAADIKAGASYYTAGSGGTSSGAISGSITGPSSSGSSSTGGTGRAILPRNAEGGSAQGFSVHAFSHFLGIGPRLGGGISLPLTGAWSLEGQLGAAALAGDRTLNVSTSGAATDFGYAAASRRNSTVVFNLDGQADLAWRVGARSEWLIGYRFDSYHGALTMLNARGAPTNVNRTFAGPVISFRHSF